MAASSFDPVSKHQIGSMEADLATFKVTKYLAQLD